MSSLKYTNAGMTGSPPPQQKPSFAQQPWWFPGWGGGYFPWTPFGMSPWESSWPGFGRPAGSRTVPRDPPASQPIFPGWPSWEECQRWANFSTGESGLEERPYGGVDLPLGGHLALSVKEKIWRGEYVDLFSLLQAEPEPVRKVGKPERDQESMKKRRSWLYGYCIYMAVVVQLHPKRAPALIKYLDIIHRILRDFGGQAWLQYDENFRLRAAHDPSLSWSTPKFELWM